MSKVIEIKPYLQFIRLEYEVEDEEFLTEHPKLKRLRTYLYKRRDAFFDAEVQKLVQIMDKGNNKR